MKYLALFLIAFLFSPSLSAQEKINDGYFKRRKDKQREGSPFSANRRDAIWSHSQSHYRPFGWFINPGLTYMMGNSANDDGQSYNLTPTGLPGYYVEVGLEHLFKREQKVFHYFDYGIGVKHFGGQEKYKDDADTKLRGQFNFGTAFGRIGIHNVWQLNLYNFIDQSIGINVDYRIYGGKDDPDYTIVANNAMPKLVGQLHYQIGFGLKVRDGFFIVPTFQTPILTALPWNGINPGHTWFQSRYQPMIFTIKFAWLFAKSGCPDVDGPSDDKNRSNNYQQR